MIKCVWMVLLPLLTASYTSYGQNTQTTITKEPLGLSRNQTDSSQEWFLKSGKRIYFPDYFVFYDPVRQGYVYWEGEQWIISNQMPSIIRDADLGKVRIQILKDETLQIPEDNFERYLRMYPPQQVNPSVLVPIITISKQKKK